MVNSSSIVSIFVVILVIAFDFNYAAVRERRGLFFGRNDQTTTRTVLKSPLGFVSVSLAGGQKAPVDPCNPSQNTQQSSGRKPLINIKIPTLFNKGSNQASTVPPECTTVTESPTTPSPITPRPSPKPSTSIPKETPEPLPVPSSPIPHVTPTPQPPPSTSGHLIESTTIDPDQDLINSIFGEESAATTLANNGAGKLDFRRLFR